MRHRGRSGGRRVGAWFMESLEPRQLLSAIPTFSGGVTSLTGAYGLVSWGTSHGTQFTSAMGGLWDIGQGRVAGRERRAGEGRLRQRVDQRRGLHLVDGRRSGPRQEILGRHLVHDDSHPGRHGRRQNRERERETPPQRAHRRTSL